MVYTQAFPGLHEDPEYPFCYRHPLVRKVFVLLPGHACLHLTLTGDSLPAAAGYNEPHLLFVGWLSHPVNLARHVRFYYVCPRSEL